MSLRVRDRVEKYEVLAPLGAGGMGEVYRALDLVLHRQVALKILHGDASEPDSQGTNGAAQMVKEARAAAALDHPNVVSIFDVGECLVEGSSKPVAYLAMELIRGASLRQRISEPSASVRERVRWLADVARALGAAHRVGLVHRDIKPENVMVRDDGIVKVLDFGIAKRVTGADPTMATVAPTGATGAASNTEGLIVGTPYYMAPEQMRGEVLDGRCDQFAWGVLAFETISGLPPWTIGASSIQLITEILTRTPAPMSTSVGVVDVDEGGWGSLNEIIAKALSKERDARFASMAAIVDALSLFVLPTPSSPALSGPGTFSLPPSNPHPARAISVRNTVDAWSNTAGIDAIDVAVVTPAEASRASEEQAPPFDGEREPPTRRSVIPPASSTTLPNPTPPRRARKALFSMVVGVVALSLGLAVWWGRSSRSVQVAQVDARASSVECSSNLNCVTSHGGKPWRCDQAAGQCRAIESSHCSTFVDPEDISSERLVWFGLMMPLSGPDAKAFGRNERNAFDLARREFAQVLGPEARAPESKLPSFGVVACDDSVDAKLSARHLVDNARVAAVVGFGKSSEMLEFGPTIFAPGGAVTLSSSNLNPLIGRMAVASGQPRMTFRTIYSLAGAVPALGAFFSETLEARVRKELHISSKNPVRFAFLRSDSPSDQALSDELYKAFRLNGRSVFENERAYREIVCPGTCAERAPLIDKVREFAPDVVFSTMPAAEEVYRSLLPAWRKSKRTPFFLTPLVMPPWMIALTGGDAMLRHRAYSVSSANRTDENARFTNLYNATFPPEGADSNPVTLGSSPNTTYDAFYALALGAIASKNAAPGGAAISTSFSLLAPEGEEFSVGPSRLRELVDVLLRGQAVRLRGATGVITFDPMSGDMPADLTIQCIDTDLNGKAATAKDSGLVYRYALKRLVGSMECP